MSDTPCVDGCGQDAATIERLRAEVEHLRKNREDAIEGGMAAVAAVATERDQLRHLLSSHADGHRCTCTMTRPPNYHPDQMTPAEWEQDPWCLTHPDMSVITAEVERMRERLAKVEAALARVEALFAGGPDTPCRTLWRAVEGVAGEWHEVECVEVPMGDLRAALTPQNHPRNAAGDPEAPGQPGRDERGSGGGIGADVDAILNGREAIRQALAGYNFGTLANMAEAIQTNPGPLLEALAEAGVLRVDRAIMRSPSTPDEPVRRYVTEWRPTDARP